MFIEQLENLLKNEELNAVVTKQFENSVLNWNK